MESWNKNNGNLLEIEGNGWTRSSSPDACILGAATCILKEEHEQSASFRGWTDWLNYRARQSWVINNTWGKNTPTLLKLKYTLELSPSQTSILGIYRRNSIEVLGIRITSSCREHSTSCSSPLIGKRYPRYQHGPFFSTAKLTWNRRIHLLPV